MNLGLEIVTRYKGYAGAAPALAAAVDESEELNSLEVREDESSNWVTLDRCIASLAVRGPKTIFLQTRSGGGISFGDIANHRLALMTIEGVVESEEEASSWVTNIMLDHRFIQARLCDADYEFWQNADDPGQFVVRGVSAEGLSFVSNGLPPPLEALVVDTSRNCGRRLLRRGYVEALGMPMWLSQEFFRRTGARLDALRKLDGLTLDDLGHQVTRLRRSAGPFSHAEGAEGELQDQLRAALFQNG